MDTESRGDFKLQIEKFGMNSHELGKMGLKSQHILYPALWVYSDKKCASGRSGILAQQPAKVFVPSAGVSPLRQE